MLQEYDVFESRIVCNSHMEFDFPTKLGILNKNMTLFNWE